VHEAFAQPWQANAGPNNPVPQKPPEPIPEEPAAEKPAGENVQWIPGYWQWDPDRNDFVWASGTWRKAPEGRHWVPGYWTGTAEGYRWVSGHWAAAGAPDYEYVPEPPTNPDQGPTTAAPNDTSFYIPGSYFYGDDGYTYRAGYWAAVRPGFVWHPASYFWTPFGWTFVRGYWDCAVVDRGLLFAPVYFTQPLWYTRGWFYRPFYTVAFAGFFDNFFIGYSWGHYFFGDFYARSYLNRGIYPWFWGTRHHFDPLWAHHHWVHRHNPHWAAGIRSNYIGRVNGTLAIPPRTFAAQAALASQGRLTANERMLSTLTEVRQSGRALTPVTPQQLRSQSQLAHPLTAHPEQLGRNTQRLSTGLHTSTPNRFTPNATPRAFNGANRMGEFSSGRGNAGFGSAGHNSAAFPGTHSNSGARPMPHTSSSAPSFRSSTPAFHGGGHFSGSAATGFHATPHINGKAASPIHGSAHSGGAAPNRFHGGSAHVSGSAGHGSHGSTGSHAAVSPHPAGNPNVHHK
jgi:hypothetical protein